MAAPILLGFATTLAVVFTEGAIAVASGFRFSTLTLGIVVPVGAILTGAAAATGLYAGAKWLHAIPRRPLVGTCVLIGFAAWFGPEWLEWRAAGGPEGAGPGGISSLLDYWALRAVSSDYEQSYLMMGFRLLGSVAGSLGIGFALADARVCTRCNRYFRVRRVGLERMSAEDAALLPPEGTFRLDLHTCDRCGDEKLWITRRSSDGSEEITLTPRG